MHCGGKKGDGWEFCGLGEYKIRKLFFPWVTQEGWWIETWKRRQHSAEATMFSRKKKSTLSSHLLFSFPVLQVSAFPAFLFFVGRTEDVSVMLIISFAKVWKDSSGHKSPGQQKCSHSQVSKKRKKKTFGFFFSFASDVKLARLWQRGLTTRDIFFPRIRAHSRFPQKKEKKKKRKCLFLNGGERDPLRLRLVEKKTQLARIFNSATLVFTNIFFLLWRQICRNLMTRRHTQRVLFF